MNYVVVDEQWTRERVLTFGVKAARKTIHLHFLRCHHLTRTMKKRLTMAISGPNPLKLLQQVHNTISNRINASSDKVYPLDPPPPL